MIDLNTFYVVISPEQDYRGKILINRKTNNLRNWYYCSQEYNNSVDLDGKILQIINAQRAIALTDAYVYCGYKGEFELAEPKSCNEDAARDYMTKRVVIVLDEFDVEKMTCKIHNGLICRSIDDDPRSWRRVRWGQKIYKRRRKPYRKNSAFGDKLQEAIKHKKAANGDQG